MSRVGVTVEVNTVNTAWVHTTLNAQLVFIWLGQLGIERQFDHKLRVWMIPRGRVADLVADAEHGGRPVHVVGGWA
jgi:hypothetical protein